jgi:hypothetical protein
MTELTSAGARVSVGVGAPRHGRTREQMNGHQNSLYRYYYYYGLLPARRGEAAMGCRRVIVI